MKERKLDFGINTKLAYSEADLRIKNETLYDYAIFNYLNQRFGQIIPQYELEPLGTIAAKNSVDTLRKVLPQEIQVYSWNRRGYSLYFRQEREEQISFIRNNLPRYKNPKLDYINGLLCRAVVSEKKPHQVIGLLKPQQEQFLNLLRAAYPKAVPDEDALEFVWDRYIHPFSDEGVRCRTNLRSFRIHINKHLKDYGFAIFRQDAIHKTHQPGEFWLEEI